MNATTVFMIGTLTSLSIGAVVVGYLRKPLEKILVELCGNQEQAAFWTAFAAMTLAIVPVIFAIAYRPSLEQNSPAVFELADQLKWGLIGLMGSLLMLGWIIGKSIIRWEARSTAKVR